MLDKESKFYIDVLEQAKQNQIEAEKEDEERRNWKPSKDKIFIPSGWQEN